MVPFLKVFTITKFICNKHFFKMNKVMYLLNLNWSLPEGRGSAKLMETKDARTVSVRQQTINFAILYSRPDLFCTV